MEKPLLVYFLEIEEISLQMLQAAQCANWNRIDNLEIQCSLLLSQLQHQAARHRLGTQDLWEKNRIMRRIMQNDAQVRDLMEPWLNECDMSRRWVQKMTH